jgi:hypothetical protein
MVFNQHISSSLLLTFFSELLITFFMIIINFRFCLILRSDYVFKIFKIIIFRFKLNVFNVLFDHFDILM